MSWREIGNAGLVAVVTACLLLATTYAVLTPWRRSATGRALMALVAALAVFGSVGIVRWLLPVAPWVPDAVRAFGTWTVTAIVLWLWGLLVRGQLKSGRRPVRKYGRRWDDAPTHETGADHGQSAPPPPQH